MKALRIDGDAGQAGSLWSTRGHESPVEVMARCNYFSQELPVIPRSTCSLAVSIRVLCGCWPAAIGLVANRETGPSVESWASACPFVSTRRHRNHLQQLQLLHTLDDAAVMLLVQSCIEDFPLYLRHLITSSASWRRRRDDIFVTAAVYSCAPVPMASLFRH